VAMMNKGAEGLFLNSTSKLAERVVKIERKPGFFFRTDKRTFCEGRSTVRPLPSPPTLPS